MLANCRHEILSYDKPQDAMRHETAETEISDDSPDILVMGKNFLNISKSPFHLKNVSPILVN